MSVLDTLQQIDRTAGRFAESAAMFDVYDSVIDQWLGEFWQGGEFGKALDRHGLPGVAWEFLMCALLRKGREMEFENDSHSGIDVERMLYRYHIPIWSRWFRTEGDSRFLKFRVKKRQARFAEYLMLCYGLDVTGKVVDPRNHARARARYAPEVERGRDGKARAVPPLPDQMPRQWKKNFWRSGNLLDRLLQIAFPFKGSK